MELFFTVLTCAIAVSLDSFLVAFALNLKTKFNLVMPTIVAIITFVLCLLSVVIGNILVDIIGEWVDIVGCVLLIGVGLGNLFRKEKQSPDTSPPNDSLTPQSAPLTPAKPTFTSIDKDMLITYCIAGFAVGMDAAVGNLSLVLLGHTSIIIPVIFSIFHFAFVCLGLVLSKLKAFQNFKRANIVAAIILVGLGIFKLF